MQTSATVGKRLASLIRAARAGQDVAPSTICHHLAQMLAADAQDPIDALALLTAANAISSRMVADEPLFDEGGMPSNAHLVHNLVFRAIQALEVATGESHAAYKGLGPAIN